MALEEFKKNLKSLKSSLDQLKKEKLSIEIKEQAPGVFKYKEMRALSVKKAIPTYIEQLRKNSSTLNHEISGNPLIAILKEVNDLEMHYSNKDVKKIDESVERIAEVIASVHSIVSRERLIRIPEKLPAEIKEDLIADIYELEKTFQTGCYRSSIIICGRILETMLHRKHFDVTGQDLLEKAPGIGLGKIIAKLKEKDVLVDPGLTQQIHLINQVRIFSVHKKQDVFYPSKAQAEGTILLTMDVMDKFYGR